MEDACTSAPLLLLSVAFVRSVVEAASQCSGGAQRQWANFFEFLIFSLVLFNSQSIETFSSIQLCFVHSPW